MFCTWPGTCRGGGGGGVYTPKHICIFEPLGLDYLHFQTLLFEKLFHLADKGLIIREY
jgi:hypothetical protein